MGITVWCVWLQQTGTQTQWSRTSFAVLSSYRVNKKEENHFTVLLLSKGKVWPTDPSFLFSDFIEPQNGQGWKGPLEVIVSNPLAQAEPCRADCLGLVPVAFEYFWGWRLHNLSIQPVSITKKKCFLLFKKNLPSFLLCPLPLVLPRIPVTVETQKN